MIGYKAFNNDLTCRGFKYEVGHTYSMDESPIPCERGFHFCKSIAETYDFFPTTEDTRICKIEALGEVQTDGKKYCTNVIKIIEEIAEDWKRKGNSNSSNSGDRNSGLFNTKKKPKLKIFDKESNWTIDDWYKSDARDIMSTCPCTYSDFVSDYSMTDEEKEKHPEYKTIGGYVKTFVVTKEDKEKWWNELSDEEKDIVKALPNFDFDKFRQCVGF